jgi:hypothetical protein
MKKIIRISCLWATKLMLCFFVFFCSGCRCLKRLDQEGPKTSQQILHIIISKADLPVFLQEIQELNMVPMDLQPRIQNSQYGEPDEFMLTFRFVDKNAFLMWRSKIMSTCIVIRISK